VVSSHQNSIFPQWSGTALHLIAHSCGDQIDDNSFIRKQQGARFQAVQYKIGGLQVQRGYLLSLKIVVYHCNNLNRLYWRLFPSSHSQTPVTKISSLKCTPSPFLLEAPRAPRPMSLPSFSCLQQLEELCPILDSVQNGLARHISFIKSNQSPVQMNQSGA